MVVVFIILLYANHSRDEFFLAILVINGHILPKFLPDQCT